MGTVMSIGIAEVLGSYVIVFKVFAFSRTNNKFKNFKALG